MTEPTSAEIPTNVFELAAPVSERVQIQAIILSSSRTNRAGDEILAQGGYTLHHKHEVVGIDGNKDTNLIAVVLLFTLISMRDEIEEVDEPTLLIEARFVLVYTITSFESIDDTNIHAFAFTNGIFNAWPYWREFVHNSSTRMNIPPIVTPVFRFFSPPSESSESPSAPPEEIVPTE